jgi:polyhydroxyalkanoate synthesis repressor PhaR
MAARVLLKKYSNRRLYDTERNAYVTLTHVGDLIKQGREVQIVDAATQQDVTAFVLTQILLEEAKKKNLLLPVPLLHLFIRYGETLLHEFFDKYLEQTLESYLAYKASFDEQFAKWLDLGADLTGAARKVFQDLPFFKTGSDLFSTPTEAPKKGKR